MTPLQFTKRRKKLFRSQAAAAEALGVTPGCVGHWETGRSKIPKTITKLLDCLEANRLATEWGNRVMRGEPVT